MNANFGTREGYGGIWLTGQPFQLNIKCVIIGLVVACIYTMPKFAGMAHWFMLAFLFCMTYIAISIYDVKYHCNARLLSGKHSVTGIFKPQNPTGDLAPADRTKVLAQDQERAYRHAVYFTHFALIAPLVMISSGIAMKQQRKLTAANKTPDYHVFPVVFGLGMLALFYHGARLIWPRDACIWSNATNQG